MGFTRKDVDFFSRGTRCGAWLYLPEGTKRPPVVVMAHGFAAEKTFGLDAFAQRFVARGIAVFVFDYRNFGASEGSPRNLVDYRRHIADWQAAIEFVRELPQVDGRRTALWGSSFSGGHVIMIAAADPKIRAVVAQVPFVDGLASAGTFGPSFILKATIKGLRDLMCIMTFREPYTVPVVGAPDKFAVMNTPDAMPGFLAILPKDTTWKNECPARILLTVTMYRPIRRAKRVSCPLLLVAAKRDSLIPAASVKKTAARAPKGELMELDIGHFEIYTGKAFEKAVDREAEFLEKYLNG
ncbi:MAG: alpha/beta fold hydrolase [Deltaproteobacteria bacterium]|nr:alpha/beta fold hydrolase [Candidatus Zymogenaceae bacterium]